MESTVAQRKVPVAEDGTRKRKTVNKIVAQAHAIFQHAVEHFGLVLNVVTKIKRLRESGEVARFDFYSPEEIDLLVATAVKGSHRDPRRPAVSETERALRAEEDQQDAAIYLTAALEGLRRSELLALLREDVDFEQSSIRVYEGYSAKQTGKPKSRKSRTVPMVDKVAHALKELKKRGHHTARGDHVFGKSREHPSRRLRAAPTLPFHSRRRRPATAALPRPAPHLRLTGDQRRQHRPGPGMDGPRRHPDDDALPTPQEPRRGRPTALNGLPTQEAQSSRARCGVTEQTCIGLTFE